jgi:hypothetical protein
LRYALPGSLTPVTLSDGFLTPLVGARQKFVKTAQRELAKMRFGVHYGHFAVQALWHWCCKGLFQLERGDEALSLGLGARGAIENALIEKPERSHRVEAVKYFAELGWWLVTDERPEAEDCLQRVLVLAEGLSQMDRALIESNALCSLAQAHIAKNDFCMAIHYAQRAMEVRRHRTLLAWSACSGGLSLLR